MMNVDDFVAGKGGFFAGAKGLPFTPGKLGFPEGISTGRRHAAQTALVHGAETSSSFWWNLGSQTDMSIHNIAFNSIGYANAENIRRQSVNPAAAEAMGISPQKLSELSLNPENRGSIAFTRLNAETSSLYYGGGEEIGQAVQTTDKINKYALMDLPDSVTHDTTGPKIFNHYYGKKTSLNKEVLRDDIQFHDWMKEYAQNVKDTLPEGSALPKGTQELLDAPSTDQMVTAARARLSEIGDTDPYEGLKISSMQTSDHEVGQVYRYSYLENGMEQQKLFRAEGLAPHIEQAKIDAPFTPLNTRQISPASAEGLLKVGEQESLPTAVSSMSPIAKSMQGAEGLEAAAKVVSDAPIENIAEGVEKTIVRTGATKELLAASGEAARAVTRGIEGASHLRVAGAAMTVLKSRL